MDIFLETLHDTYLIFPILFIMYLFLEYFEHKNENLKYTPLLSRYGPLLGAFFGLIPQCGFGVLASMLFIENKLTLGTLISVYIATSDEAIPILIAYPEQYQCLVFIIIIKLILAIFTGYIVDYFFKNNHFSYHLDESKHKHHSSFIIDSFIRAAKIYTVIFIINFILSFAIDWIGTDKLSLLLFNQSLMQPIVSAIFGFIPHCASSVILTQLHIHQVLSFSSLLAGLITNAGLGILVLLQNRVNTKMILKICIILFISALLVSLPLQWFQFLS